MTDASDSRTKPKPKRKPKLKPVLAGTLLLGLGAGGAYAAVALGAIGGAQATPEADVPKLVRKGQDDPYAPAAEAKDEGGDIVEGEGGSAYRTSYYRFEDSFTSNLAGSPALIQVTLAASTRYDGRVLQWLDKHQLALRSAILIELAETSEEEAASVQGKAALRKRLAKAINRVLKDLEGFGGVDQVHFQGYLVQ